MKKEELEKQYLDSYDFPDWIGKLVIGFTLIVITLACMAIAFIFVSGLCYLARIII